HDITLLPASSVRVAVAAHGELAARTASAAAVASERVGAAEVAVLVRRAVGVAVTARRLPAAPWPVVAVVVAIATHGIVPAGVALLDLRGARRYEHGVDVAVAAQRQVAARRAGVLAIATPGIRESFVALLTRCVIREAIATLRQRA